MIEEKMKTALVIEDDPDIASAISNELASITFSTEHASDGLRGLQMAQNGGYAIIVLDLMLPKMEGVEVCRQIRCFDVTTPILVLTARNQESDKVLLLELGADDFISKPFSTAELRARVKALVRRSELSVHPGQTPEIIRIGPFTIEPGKRRLTSNGQAVVVTANEFDLFYALAQHPGRAFSRSQLANLVHGYDSNAYDHSVSSAINRLRAKIEPDPANPRYILTVRGIGYAFAEVA